METLLYILLSSIFFIHATEKIKPAKIVFCLKCYCIFMMPLAIEALMRSMVYVSDWSYVLSDEEGGFVFFLIVSLVVLCFVFLSLWINLSIT